MLRLIIKIVSSAAFLASCIWLWGNRSMEPVIAAFGSLAALLGSFLVPSKEEKPKEQTQHISGNGIGIQSKGDVNIRDFNGQNKK